MHFSEINLKEEIVKAIEEIGYKELTPVQEQTIPFLIENKSDLIALAQTGTGKTAAFSLPILNNINLNKSHIQALILCPTRELCLQIEKDISQYSKYITGLQSLAIYGGSSIETQIRALNRGNIQIIVGTPGRVIDLIDRKKLKISEIDFLVLDEADEMLSMGFKEDIDIILRTTPDSKQVLLFSATMPKNVEMITKNYMNNPHRVSISKRNEGNDSISHICYVSPPRERYEVLKRIVDSNPNIYGMIFCRTRQETKEVSENLIKDGYKVDSLHGDLSQSQRDYVMNLFRNKHIRILIATDVAARGIDVEDLTHIINYKIPDEAEVYVHRSGRTGRAGKKGISIAIITNSERRKLSFIERIMNKKFHLEKIPNGEDICEKQLFHLIEKIDTTEVNEKQIKKYLETSYSSFEHLSKEELIKKIISVEFNRFLDYYKNSKDMNIADEKRVSSRNSDRDYGRQDRDYNRNNPKERSGGYNRDKPQRRNSEGFVNFFINIGENDNISKVDIIGLLNRYTKKRLDIGRIKILREFSFFEVSEDGVNSVLDIKTSSINDFNKKISIEIAKG